MLQQLREAQDRWQIQHFYVGFSGGVDSTALLRGCVAVLPELQPDTQLTALHVNHGLHPQADVWAAHCRRICDELSVVLQTGEVTLPREGNMEANARQARYDYFTQHVGRNSCLLLGHHQDDQVETLLQRLFSGRGWLPMQTSAVLGEGYLLRPLLKCTRTQMQEYVTGQQLAWVEDTSNTDRHLQRNFLRHEVVPLLQQRWPSLAQSLQRVANQSRATEAALQNALIPLGNRV
ncbi:MAG: tRNA lysidine(34) synthetase TilS, partial [Pseudomonadota bacterium]